MTPGTLTASLRARTGETPTPDEPGAWLAWLEPHAERDWRWEDAVTQVRDWLDARAAVPAGATLVAWDGTTVTWDHHDPHGGMATRCRSLRRPDAAGRRSLVRQARALGEAGLSVHLDHLDGRAVVRVSGAPLQARAEAPAAARARLIGRLLVQLIALGEHGMVPSEPEASLLSTPEGPMLAPLAVQSSPFPDAVRGLLGQLPSAGTSWEPLVSAWLAAPPASPATADDALRRHLGAHLTSLHHRLVGRQVHTHQRGRKGRLLALAQALRAAAPPPSCRGAVGVDLEGRILVVESDGERVQWGLTDETPAVVLGPEGLDPRETRRLLRTRAAAPANPRLDREVGGDTEAVDALCRWLATASRLRTLRMMLEATS